MRQLVAFIAMAVLFLAPPSFSADTFGIFETVLESSVSFADTTDAVEAGFDESELVLHGSHDVRVPDGKHQARVYILTSPAYAAAAAEESVRTVSAQVLRIAV